jgi:hypothetical protein
VEFLRVDVGGRILAAIDDAGLQRLVDFRESQNLRQRAEAAVGRVFEDWIRILRPLKSSSLRIGLFDVITEKPLSQ